MNFYGHAFFAARISPDRRFALGSMLPDFEGMCGARVVAAEDDAIARGIALHHATDTVFHGAPEFLELCTAGLDDLTTAGVGRATARACAHVGTELVFDSYLIDTFGEDEVYLDALDGADPRLLGSGLAFADGGARFESLRRRLRDFGVPRAYGDPSFVADRLVNALAARPRLAMRDGDRARVVAWLEGSDRRIRDTAPALAARVASALSAPLARD